jgi:hypothetical protein
MAGILTEDLDKYAEMVYNGCNIKEGAIAMKQIRVIDTCTFSPSEIEAEVNETMRQLSANHRYITKTQYCIDKDGDLQMVIIEHDEE